jgi:LicD family
LNTKIFLEIIKLLNNLNVTYWLDSGALLGLFRNGSLISWDNDIDIGVWPEGADLLLQKKQFFKKEGISIAIRKYNKIVYGLTLTKDKQVKSLPIHVHVFFKEKNIAWSPQTVIYKPEQPPYPSWVTEKPSGMRNFLTFCKKEAKGMREGVFSFPRNLIGLLIGYPVWGGFYTTKKKIDRKYWGSLWPYSLFHRIYSWIIPAAFFENLTFIEIDQEQIPIPGQTDEYLKLRYHDWRTAVQNWCYWKDDGCLRPMIPEKALRQI